MRKKTLPGIIAMISLMLMTLSVSIDSEAALNIFRVKGNVKVKNSSGASKDAKQRATVTKSDVLTIPKGGNIEILNSDNRRIFSSIEHGTMTVQELIDKANKDAQAITRKTNTGLGDAIADNAKLKRSSFASTGVSVHTANAIIHAPIDLPDGVSYLEYLRRMKNGNEYDDDNDVILIRRNIDYDDETFNFAVFNTLDIPLYFNIIDQTNNRELELYFQENPIAIPKTQTIVEEYRYLVPDEGMGHILIASDQEFTETDIKKLLDPDYEPKADFYFSLIR